MKLAGAFLCFAACALGGFFAGRRERERTALCEAFYSFFLYIRGQIDAYLTPTKQIFRSYADPTLEKIGFLRALTAHETDAVYHDAWQAAMRECASKWALNETQTALVAAFGASIGKTGGEMQLRQMDRYLSQMSAETERQRAEAKKNEKLYRTLGLSLGAVAAILIL